MKRVMCVYLPRWPLQRLLHEQPALRDRPVALVNPKGRRGAEVVLCSAEADRAGVRPGMPAAEALAVAPRLIVRGQEPGADRRGLAGLVRWLERFSPVVAPEDSPEPKSVLLDVTGCAGCFGGEDRLLRRAADELAGEGWDARVAMADTVGAAWGLAHHGSTPFLAPPGETRRVLADLPVAALRLSDSALGALAGLGIGRVGQLLELPRDELPARLGPLVLSRLDQALGRRVEPVVPPRPLPEVQAFYRFEHPTDRRDALNHVLDGMVKRIQGVLQERGWGARRVECRLYQPSASPLRLDVGLSRPSDSAEHIGTLLRTRLEAVMLVGPVRSVELRVPAAEPVGDRQRQLFETDAEAAEELAGLIDRLSNRLGREVVTRVMLVPDPQPEYACRFEPVVSGAAGSETHAERSSTDRNVCATPSLVAQTFLSVPPPKFEFSPECLRVFVHRPLLLWPEPVPVEVTSVVPDGPPIRFRWEGEDHAVARARGPERVEAGWWRGGDVRRDYYMVTTASGGRFWIFRQRDDGRWFMHGGFE